MGLFQDNLGEYLGVNLNKMTKRPVKKKGHSYESANHEKILTTAVMFGMFIEITFFFIGPGNS